MTEVGICPISLSLALNLIMSYELAYEQKGKYRQDTRKSLNEHEIIKKIFITKGILKKLLVKNNPYENQFNETNSHSFLDQIFYTNPNADKITSWQIRVKIIELRHLVGSNETVYCLVEIADQKFRTKEKRIDDLHFKDDEIFIARIDGKMFQKAFNYKIQISVSKLALFLSAQPTRLV